MAAVVGEEGEDEEEEERDHMEAEDSEGLPTDILVEAEEVDIVEAAVAEEVEADMVTEEEEEEEADMRLYLDMVVVEGVVEADGIESAMYRVTTSVYGYLSSPNVPCDECDNDRAFVPVFGTFVFAVLYVVDLI